MKSGTGRREIKMISQQVAKEYGLQRWIGDKGMVRYYFNGLAELVKPEGRHLQSAIIFAKAWLNQDGELHVTGDRDLISPITQAVGAISKAVVRKSARFSRELNRRAWEIRRRAAAKFGLKVMEISWSECLKSARGQI